MRKKYVKVISETDTDGNILPITIIWDEYAKYNIDKVLDIRPCASLKSGGIGLRYTVRILGQTTYLYLEETKWFVEAK